MWAGLPYPIWNFSNGKILLWGLHKPGQNVPRVLLQSEAPLTHSSFFPSPLLQLSLKVSLLILLLFHFILHRCFSYYSCTSNFVFSEDPNWHWGKVIQAGGKGQEGKGGENNRRQRQKGTMRKKNWENLRERKRETETECKWDHIYCTHSNLGCSARTWRLNFCSYPDCHC